MAILRGGLVACRLLANSEPEFPVSLIPWTVEPTRIECEWQSIYYTPTALAYLLLLSSLSLSLLLLLFRRIILCFSCCSCTKLAGGGGCGKASQTNFVSFRLDLSTTLSFATARAAPIFVQTQLSAHRSPRPQPPCPTLPRPPTASSLVHPHPPLSQNHSKRKNERSQERSVQTARMVPTSLTQKTPRSSTMHPPPTAQIPLFLLSQGISQLLLLPARPPLRLPRPSSSPSSPTAPKRRAPSLNL